MRIASHKHDIEDRRREVPVDGAALRHVGNFFVDGRERLLPEAYFT